MADYTGMSLEIGGLPPEHHEELSAGIGGHSWSHQIEPDGSMHWSGSQSYGTQEDIMSYLDAFMEEHEVEFAYCMAFDPKWEWDGQVTYSVPGVGSFSSDADAERRIHLKDSVLHALIDEARAVPGTEQEYVSSRLEELTGRRVIEAWKTYGLAPPKGTT